jgi:hypothetical protein
MNKLIIQVKDVKVKANEPSFTIAGEASWPEANFENARLSCNFEVNLPTELLQVLVMDCPIRGTVDGVIRGLLSP